MTVAESASLNFSHISTAVGSRAGQHICISWTGTEQSCSVFSGYNVMCVAYYMYEPSVAVYVYIHTCHGITYNVHVYACVDVDVRVYTCVSPLVFDEHDCLQRPHSNTPLSHSYSLGE